MQVLKNIYQGAIWPTLIMTEITVKATTQNVKPKWLLMGDGHKRDVRPQDVKILILI